MPLQVLFVEDSPDDAELVLHELHHHGLEVVHERVETRQELQAALDRRPWDVIISDYSLPAFNGFDALNLVREKDVDLPFILISGTIGEDIAVAAMKAGAHDYLIKGQLARLGPAIDRELREAETRRERRRAEMRLHAWQRELEVRVQERTSELTTAHEQLKSAVEERKRLEAEIAQAIEREQLRLGRELHDNLGQQLTGVNYMLMAAHSKMGNTPLASEVMKMQSLIQECIDKSRNLAQWFYPVDLERLGLPAAVQELANRPGPPVNISLVAEPNADSSYADLENSVAIQLFRIAQEAVQNARSHAQSERIVVRLARANEQITLTVQDEGVGFPPHVDQSKSLGLRIMQYRAEAVGGTLRIGNNPTGGAFVTCTAPSDGKRAAPQKKSKSRDTAKRSRHRVA